MEIIHQISELRKKLQKYHRSNKNIGFVPTMGYLHKGHIKLIEEAVQQNEIVVVSIFVNPTQFGPEEDYEEYPRNLKRDAAKSQKAGVDYIFAPDAAEMYSHKYKTFVEVEELTDKLCGSSRPDHFRGVTTVVSKLFNIVEPDRAYFGQKDFQQFQVIKRMVEDLNFSLELKMVPIVREDDGLAVSSRNKYLNQAERNAATILYQALNKGKQMILDNEIDAHKVRKEMENMIKNEELAQIDYVKVVDPETLEDIDQIHDKVLLVMAVFIGETRLIDNFFIDINEGNGKYN